MNHLALRQTEGRARWLAQLTAALDETQQLLSQLSVMGSDPGEAVRLRTLVLALSREIELLRSEGFAGKRLVATEPLRPSWRRS